MKGPDRKTYYDMNPWYLKNLNNGLSDWHQHVVSADKVLLEKVESVISEKSPTNVLEIGCGGGDFTLLYSKPTFKTHIAFEYSSVATDMAKKKNNPNLIDFREGDALDSNSYLEGPFDLIIAKDVLHCILGNDRELFYKNIKQSLSSNGMAVLTTHVGLPVHPEIKKFVDYKTRENHIQTRVYLDKETIETEIIEAGFVVEETIALDGQLELFVLK